MKKLYLATLVSALSVSAFAAPAPADLSSDTTVSTKGGFEIKNDLFSAKIGGRFHIDGRYVNEEDDLSATSQATNSTVSFRRARLTMEGKAYGWGYKFENDFAGQDGTTGSGFREAWIGTKFMGQNVRIGQAKPYRGMEELTSSNEMTFMERPSTTGTALYRQFQQGVFVDSATKVADMDVGYGVAVYNTRSAADKATQGMGYNGRVHVAPINGGGQALHLAASYSADRNPLSGATPAATTNSDAFRVRPNMMRDVIRPTLVGSNVKQQDSFAVEAAFMSGPFYVQAEYASADHDFIGTTASQQVDAAYVQTSFFVTDHARKYDAKKGVFKSPSVTSGAGAIELKARYDMIENKDTNAEMDYFAVGANYYINPNTRVMFEYIDGTQTIANVDTDASAIQTRLQFAF